jgi:hypothetical protein
MPRLLFYMYIIGHLAGEGTRYLRLQPALGWQTGNPGVKSLLWRIYEFLQGSMACFVVYDRLNRI